MLVVRVVYQNPYFLHVCNNFMQLQHNEKFNICHVSPEFVERILRFCNCLICVLFTDIPVDFRRLLVAYANLHRRYIVQRIRILEMYRLYAIPLQGCQSKMEDVKYMDVQ